IEDRPSRPCDESRRRRHHPAAKFAALTIASTRSAVMSPVTSSIRTPNTNALPAPANELPTFHSPAERCCTAMEPVMERDLCYVGVTRGVALFVDLSVEGGWLATLGSLGLIRRCSLRRPTNRTTPNTRWPARSSGGKKPLTVAMRQPISQLVSRARA